MLHKGFIFKQIVHCRSQALMFVLCVALSMTSLFALESFSRSVNRSLLSDARRLQAADIIVKSRTRISPELVARIEAFESQGLITGVRITEFYSMARSVDAADSLLVKIKAVGPGYPFYGEVGLGSKRPFASTLHPGTAIVAPAVLKRLNVGVNDRLVVGDRVLRITDTVLKEPDQPLDVFNIGPRVFVNRQDLESLGLVDTASRVRQRLLIKVHDTQQLNSIYRTLQQIATDTDQVDTFRTIESRIKRFFDNFINFLDIIGIFTLLLAGFGIQSTLTALLRQSRPSVAVLKAVGADGRFVLTHFMALALVLGTIGTLLGLIGGAGVQAILVQILEGLLPDAVKVDMSWPILVQGLAVGLITVLVFSFLPLYRLKHMKPNVIFRHEGRSMPNALPTVAATTMVLTLLIALSLWRLESVRVGLYFAGGSVALLLLTAAGARGLLHLFKRLPTGRLALQQALKGLLRPGNATTVFIVTTGAALSVVFVIYLIETNLDATYVRSYPPDAPNLFFIDIQPDQRNEFIDTLGRSAEMYPIVRARIVSIDGQKIDRRAERRRRGDNLARPFNLTYRRHLLNDEVIQEGSSLFRTDFDGIQVSVLDTVQQIRPLDLGSRITFNIQGVPLEATVTSIRTRRSESFSPFFYFVFQPEVLQDAPQTIFTALRADSAESTSLQNRIVRRFPHVSVIDIADTVKVFSKTLRKFSTIIRFFTVFCVGAGILIIISALLATRLARIRETAYYKILGAHKFFVLQVFTIEHAILGSISAILALLFSEAAAYAICTFLFEIEYHPFWTAGLLMVAATMGGVMLIGVLSSIRIMNQKPVVILREQFDG